MIKRKSAKQNIFSSLIIRSFFGLLFVSFFTLGLYVYAASHTVTDTFIDDSNIASTWQVEISSTTGEFRLESRECDPDDWFCGASTTCASTMGDGDYIVVAKSDSPTTYAWQLGVATACAAPHCSR